MNSSLLESLEPGNDSSVAAAHALLRRTVEPLLDLRAFSARDLHLAMRRYSRELCGRRRGPTSFAKGVGGKDLSSCISLEAGVEGSRGEGTPEPEPPIATVWRGLVAAFGEPATEGERRRWLAAAAELEAIAATPAEIVSRRKRMAVKWGTQSTQTPRAMVDNWTALGPPRGVTALPLADLEPAAEVLEASTPMTDEMRAQLAAIKAAGRRGTTQKLGDVLTPAVDMPSGHPVGHDSPQPQELR